MQRFYGVVQNQAGLPVEGAAVSVTPAGSSTLAIIYQASGSRTAPSSQANPITTDPNGEYSFAAADGLYDITITGGDISSKLIANVILYDDLNTAPSPALGTVTSVSATVPAFMTVTGSPVTGAGTLGLTMNSQTQNLVLASPAAASGTPDFRALVTNDLPSAGTAGTYGSATQVPQLTTDAKGRVTGVSAVTITPAFSSLTGTPTTLAGYGILDAAKLGTAQQFTKAQNVTMVTLSYAATVNTDASLSNTFYLAATGNFTLANPTNLGSGGCYIWLIKQDATGSRLITFGAKFKFAGGVAPLLSTAANALDRLVATYDATNDILLCSLEKGFA